MARRPITIDLVELMVGLRPPAWVGLTMLAHFRLMVTARMQGNWLVELII